MYQKRLFFFISGRWPTLSCSWHRSQCQVQRSILWS